MLAQQSAVELLYRDQTEFEVLYHTDITEAMDRAKDREIFDIQNRIRTDPLSFVADLEDLLDRYNVDTGTYLSSTGWVKYIDHAALQECIEYMKTVPAVPALKWSVALESAAKYHTDTLGDSDEWSHVSPDGHTP